MPHVTEAPVQAYAHCANSVCPGNEQVTVDAVRRETAMLYTDLGGDLPGFERSHVDCVFADEADRVCPECGGPRECSPTPRKQYDALSGYDPRYLVSRAAKRFDAGRQAAPDDGRVNELEGQVAELSGQVQALLAKLSEAA